jgi:uncharacterized protein (DUF486 family)
MDPAAVRCQHAHHQQQGGLYMSLTWAWHSRQKSNASSWLMSVLESWDVFATHFWLFLLFTMYV